MHQQAMFHEDIYDALKSAVKCLGGTKKVGERLWPEKTLAAAQSYLNDCLNRDREAKLDPEQVLLLLRWSREAGCHEAMHYIAGAAGYANPAPIEPEDELAGLIRKYLEDKAHAAAVEPRIEQMLVKLRAA